MSNMITIRVRNLTEPSDNGTGSRKKGPNQALILGIVGALIILSIAGVIYFVMTKRGPYELPPDEFELEPEGLSSSIDSKDRGSS
jgi:hypothetical protein